MNVLLAEANVSLTSLSRWNDINRTIAGVDVCVVVAANDVVNPAARESTAVRSTACRLST
jgi:NAD(P) transhydrogenase subunit beta